MGVYRGRIQRGDYFSVFCQVTDTDGVPGWPLLPPQFAFWHDGEYLTDFAEMPTSDRANAVGFFESRCRASSLFPVPARVSVVKRWVHDSLPWVDIDRIDLAAGGDPEGAVIALSSHTLPQAAFLVFQTDSGLVARGKNPRVK